MHGSKSAYAEWAFWRVWFLQEHFVTDIGQVRRRSPDERALPRIKVPTLRSSPMSVFSLRVPRAYRPAALQRIENVSKDEDAGVMLLRCKAERNSLRKLPLIVEAMHTRRLALSHYFILDHSKVEIDIFYLWFEASAHIGIDYVKTSLHVLMRFKKITKKYFWKITIVCAFSVRAGHSNMCCY